MYYPKTMHTLQYPNTPLELPLALAPSTLPPPPYEELGPPFESPSRMEPFLIRRGYGTPWTY